MFDAELFKKELIATYNETYPADPNKEKLFEPATIEICSRLITIALEKYSNENNL